jgi:hypothetical protein
VTEYVVQRLDPSGWRDLSPPASTLAPSVPPPFTSYAAASEDRRCRQVLFPGTSFRVSARDDAGTAVSTAQSAQRQSPRRQGGGRGVRRGKVNERRDA